MIDVDRNVPAAPSVQAVVDSLKPGVVARYGDVYRTVLAEAEGDVSKTYDPDRAKRDTGMGNLITDALRHETRTEIALTVTGLVSEGLYAGPLLGADLFRPVSYGYDQATGLGLRIATLDLLGSELRAGMEACLSYAGVTETFDLQVSGMRFRYDSRRPVGERVRSVRIHGRPLDPTRLYSVTVNEGIAMLLPLMGVEARNLQILPDLEYDVLVDYVVRLGTVDYGSMGRVQDVAACGRNVFGRAQELRRQHFGRIRPPTTGAFSAGDSDPDKSDESPISSIGEAEARAGGMREPSGRVMSGI